MKILHTSDWHIGRSLYGRKRYDECRAFLDWLAGRLVSEEIDVLLVAGDIFDSSTPSNRALELYYTFLCRVSESSCRHVVITGGNHDSPSLLNAPREVLRFLDIHIIGRMTDLPDQEVLVLRDGAGKACLIVCAVPFLRDRDIREARAGESLEEKGNKLIDGIATHYRDVAAIARQRRGEEGGNIPIVAMGHLFCAGARTADADGVRDLYIGSLAHLDSAIFPDCIDYLALGHLHIPQKVGGSETRRYSGSPLPMGFSEAGQDKSVLIVTFDGTVPAVSTLQVPCFMALETVRGDLAVILARLEQLVKQRTPILIEVVYEGDDLVGDLQNQLQDAVAGSTVHILRTVNNRILKQALQQDHAGETLAELSVHQVFDRCLAAHLVPEEQCQDLRIAFLEAVSSLYHDDTRAE
ncbi:MAG: exonuclease SbcCD subunit D C-terminal domain-containing protein [Desulfocapsaceae bacterium]|nr:exonuclease SbcCD subunit D C-terminal domain-containing protein [Desulfocapsaceae bacterium]